MAKKFKFKLAPVLKYRSMIEDEMKTRFAHAQGIRNAKEAEIRSLQQESAQAKDAMLDAKTGRIDGTMLRNLNRYITGLHVSEMQRSGELRAIEVEVEKRRLEFVESRKQVRVIEKVKEKLQESHRYEENREATALFDELALQKVAAQGRIKTPGQPEDVVELAREAEKLEATLQVEHAHSHRESASTHGGGE